MKLIVFCSGVGCTIPAASSLFASLPESLIRLLQDTDTSPPLLTPDAVARLYDNNLVDSDIVNTRGQNYAPYVSTALVARDMLEITRAHGREKLQYWGVSYVHELNDNSPAHSVSRIREFPGRDIRRYAS